eukprot:1106032-Amphidinium_carterae.1
MARFCYSYQNFCCVLNGTDTQYCLLEENHSFLARAEEAKVAGGTKPNGSLTEETGVSFQP